jgi:hypothetical protein
MDTPVLFLIFNRPENTRLVFEAIAVVKPRQLFVAADGPRDATDEEGCRSAREIINEVDWDCEVTTLFRETNLGCKRAVSSAIDWFFDQVEAGIILEHDCLPTRSFFTFCTESLERYRDDERVMMVSGNNFQGGIRRGDACCYFSQIPHIWGWATWRRAWAHYDVNMSVFLAWLQSGDAERAWPDRDVRTFWLSKLIPTCEGQLVTWDYQWAFSMIRRLAFSVAPQQNLVSNIGFGGEATNTKNENDVCANVERHEMESLAYPCDVIVQADADLYEYMYVYNTGYHSMQNPTLRWRKVLRKRWKILRMVKRFKKQYGVQKRGV